MPIVNFDEKQTTGTMVAALVRSTWTGGPRWLLAGELDPLVVGLAEGLPTTGGVLHSHKPSAQHREGCTPAVGGLEVWVVGSEDLNSGDCGTELLADPWSSTELAGLPGPGTSMAW